MFYTTLNKIREYHPCSEGWRRLLGYLGKAEADDELLSFKTILESNGLEYAIQALQSIDAPEVALFAVRCVRQVQHMIKNTNLYDALDVAERFAVGDATDEELRYAYFIACNSYRTYIQSTSPRVYNAESEALAAWAVSASTSAKVRDVADIASKAAVCIRRFEKEIFIHKTPEYISQKDDFVAIFCSED